MILMRAYYSDCTLGRLFTVGFSCHTLELPWRGNNSDEDYRKASCIPEGQYNYRVALSPRLGVPVIWIDGVPDRTAIQIHPGNYTRQLLGCAAVGESIKDLNLDGTPDVTNSQKTFERLLAVIPEKGIITIKTASQPGVGVYK
jgi:hypothetical protein